MGASGTLAADVLVDMIMPFGQFLIGTLVLVTLVVSVRRLLERGPSRMGGAMLLSGGAVIGLAVVGYLFQLL
ncbi:hypothetical protein KOI35_38610 [Actinoplanes bogorensis]|uniref:Uncharacterized protein n=1 Tax=Paractinoplanes bogorensis TaxID=1610840 RepID=A0ABS5Z276_9ACTN|nr:hypothetical protein [Actinoplanes bogorensis]MBU2669441.1 hypothetical protein [Actinoplanes bogorensis]